MKTINPTASTSERKQRLLSFFSLLEWLLQLLRSLYLQKAKSPEVSVGSSPSA